MPTDPPKPPAETAGAERPDTGRRLTPAAQRALAEAATRRAQKAADPAAPKDTPKEIGGRDGPEPTRYGDWEINGLTSDF